MDIKQTKVEKIAMPRIEYDASEDALFNPQLQAPLFGAGAQPDDLALAVEAARLAYFRFEKQTEQKEQLETALGHLGFQDFKYFNDPLPDLELLLQRHAIAASRHPSV